MARRMLVIPKRLFFVDEYCAALSCHLPRIAFRNREAAEAYIRDYPGLPLIVHEVTRATAAKVFAELDVKMMDYLASWMVCLSRET